MADYWSVLQGGALAVDVVLKDSAEAVITTYLGTETLTGFVWPQGPTPIAANMTASWRSAPAGTVRVSLTDAQTALLAAVRHRMAVKLASGGVTSVVYEAYLDVRQAPVSATPVSATYPSGQGTAPARLAAAYATDEAVARRLCADWFAVVPRWQMRAAGVDGVIAAALPWVLTSALVDLGQCGVTGGSVIALTAPNSLFKGAGELFAVDSVSGHSATLRRVGEPLGVGQPPAPFGATGVGFEVRTLTQQIDSACREINRLEGIDPRLVGRTAADLDDSQALEDFTVLTVAERLYAVVRGDKGEYAAKQDSVQKELERVRDRLIVRWTPSRVGQASTTSALGKVRITR